MARWGGHGWDSAETGGADPWASYGGTGAASSWAGGDSWSSGGGGGGRGGGNNWDSWEDSSWAKDGSDQWGDGGWAAGDDGWKSGGGGGGNAWGEQDSSDVSSWAPNIRCVNWNGLQLVPIEKNFHEEHPAVSSRTEAEVLEIRKHHDIEVLAGDDVSIPKPVTAFEESGFPAWLLDAIKAKGFNAPTPIQIQVWPIALQGRDLIGIAETGSGKTLAYLLPMMIHILAQEELKPNEGPVGVVLCPTRELAVQIYEVSQDYIGQSGLRSAVIYGGVDAKQQGRALEEKTDIVVATPGRFIQLLNQGCTNLNRVTYVVLDEADVMLKVGFGEQIRLILSQVRPDRQMLMFSATWPRSVQKLACEHCTASEGLEPVTIRVGGDRLAACRTISQTVLVLPSAEDKFRKLTEAIRKSGCDKEGAPGKCLVFCRTKATVDRLVWELHEDGIQANGLHSGKMQSDRQLALDSFKNGEQSCLVSTACLSRGHDIPRVRYVVNYDVPSDVESYVHSIGRTGRAGEAGFAMTFLTSKEAKMAGQLIGVLKETQQKVPDKLEELAREAEEAEAAWSEQAWNEPAWNEQAWNEGA